MAAPNIETHKEDILNKLQEAGAKGLNKTALGIRSSRPKQRALALTELETEGKIANLESGKKFLYVLKSFDNPMEMACARIEAKAAAVSKENQLLSRSKLIKASQKGCPGKVKQRLERAVDWLVQEKKLLKLKHGRYFLFLHAAAVQAGPVQAETEEQAAAPHTAPVQNEERTPAPHTAPVQPQTGEQAAAIHTEETGNLPELDRETVLAAYRKVRQRTGFSSVEIYNLQQELGAPMDALKAFLLEESRQGGAVLSMGDWSLSSEETRSGAVELHGSQYLLVRFKDA